MDRRLLVLAGVSTLIGIASANPPSIADLQAAVDRATISAAVGSTDPIAWVALARAYDRTGRETDALRAYTHALPAAEAHEACARLKCCDDERATVEHFTAAIALWDNAKDRAAADRCRREFIRVSNDRAANRTILVELLRRDPPDPRTAVELADLFDRAGRPEQCVEALERWAAALPDVPGPRIALHLAAFQRQQPAAYDDTLQQLIDSINANEPKNRAAGTIVAALQRDSTATMAVLTRAGHSLNRRRVDEPFAPGWLAYRLGYTSDRNEPIVQLVRSWHAAVHPAREPEVFQALLHLLELNGEFAEVERMCSKALANPRSKSTDFLHRHHAIALMRLERRDEALTAADEAVRLASEQSFISNRLVRIDVLDWFGRLDDVKGAARALLEEFVEPDKELRVRSHLAALAAHRGDSISAIAHLERALELAPGDPGPHNDLGYYLAEANRDLPEAERLCRFAVEKGRAPVDEYDPGGADPAYRDSLAWVYYRQGRLIAAQTEFQRALALPGGRCDPFVWDHLGDVLAARGKMAEARAAWAEALARPARLTRYQGDPRVPLLKKKLSDGHRPPMTREG